MKTFVEHDDFCPCTRFYTQEYFCTCGATECNKALNENSKKFEKKLKEINRKMKTNGLTR